MTGRCGNFGGSKPFVEMPLSRLRRELVIDYVSYLCYEAAILSAVHVRSQRGTKDEAKPGRNNARRERRRLPADAKAMAGWPAEASAKAGALFDIVNRKGTPIGMGVEPTGERVPAQALSRSGSLRANARSRHESAHFGETNPRYPSATGAGPRPRAATVQWPAPCYSLLFTGVGCVAHAGDAGRERCCH